MGFISHSINQDSSLWKGELKLLWKLIGMMPSGVSNFLRKLSLLPDILIYTMQPVELHGPLWEAGLCQSGELSTPWLATGMGNPTKKERAPDTSRMVHQTGLLYPHLWQDPEDGGPWKICIIVNFNSIWLNASTCVASSSGSGLQLENWEAVLRSWIQTDLPSASQISNKLFQTALGSVSNLTGP